MNVHPAPDMVTPTGKQKRARAGEHTRISFEVLKAHFHLPMVDVARKFGICTTLFKRMCRQHNIKRWPFRKLKKIEKRVEALLVAGPNTNLNPRRKEEISTLMAEKQHIMCTGAPLGKDDENDEDFDEGIPKMPSQNPIQANQQAYAGMVPTKSAPRRNEPAVSEISHVTVSGCEIGITLDALHKLAGFFWPTPV